MKTIRLLLAVGLLAAALGHSARSEDEVKPVAAIKNKAIEASVIVDAELKAYPKLYANLVAAGKREMAKWAAEAEKERRSNPDAFSGDRRWYFDRGYSLRSIVGRYVSIVRGDETYGGGAHPNHDLNTLLWDATSNKYINIGPFFAKTKDGAPALQALAKAIRAALAVEKKARDIVIENPETDSELASVKPTLTTIGGIALAPSTAKGKSSGFSVYFSPYAVGSYAEGPYIVFVPWTAFKGELSAQGLALFGGERPPGDDKND